MLLQALIDAHERGDVNAIISLLRDDVQMTLFPAGVTWDGREAVACEYLRLTAEFRGSHVRSVPVAANRQPALAVYTRAAGAKEFKAWAIVLLSVQDGGLREIATFASPEIFVHFNIPTTLADASGTNP